MAQQTIAQQAVTQKAVKPGRGSGFRSLRFRLMLWNFAAGVLTAVGILVAVREGVRHTLYYDLDQALREDLNEIAAYFQPRGKQDLRPIQDELARKAQTHDYHGWFVEFLNERGEVVWSSRNAPAGLKRISLANADPGTIEGILRVDGYRIRYETLPDGGDAAAVAVGCNERFIARDMANIDELVVIVGGVVVLIAPIAGYLLAGRTTKILSNLIGAAGRLRPSELKERLPIRDTHDELDALAATINGLLDRIADYLQQKHDFLANAAHELRTPLAAIRSSVEVALGGNRSEAEYRELLDDVIDECQALEALVNQLLLLSESDADRLLTAAEPVALDELVTRAVDMFQAVAEDRGLRLTYNRPPPIAIIGNRHHLRQVLNNLLDNAIKFTASRLSAEETAAEEEPSDASSGAKGGHIHINLTRDDDRKVGVLRVADNGVGIPADSLPSIFDRFYRVDKARVRDGKGSGLGLSICQAIVSAHQGTIEVTSEPGGGTTFIVTIPLAPTATVPSTKAPLAT